MSENKVKVLKNKSEDALERYRKLEEAEQAIPEAIAEADEKIIKMEEENTAAFIKAAIDNKVFTQAEYEQWKEAHGKIFGVRLGPDEFYVYRQCTYVDYKEIMSNYNKASQSAQTSDLLEELMVGKCLIYPTFTSEFKVTSPYGLMGTLATQISFSSNRIPTEYAIQLITKL